MEKIISITEVTYKKDNHSRYYGCFDGYKIVTDTQEIILGIDNTQSCCENWGYFMSEDNLNDFIGAELIDISITDTALKSYDIVNNMYEGDTMFVNINTNKGLLQFVAYNEHNGYYGHEAIVISQQLNYETCL